MFELPAQLPIDRTLEITVMDHDLLSANDLIGTTTIDLENRYLTKYFALSGLPETFSKLVNSWSWETHLTLCVPAQHSPLSKKNTIQAAH